MVQPVVPTKAAAEVIAAENPTGFNAAVTDTPTRRTLRSAVQVGITLLVMFILAGGFTPIINDHIKDLDDSYIYAIGLAVFLITVQVQNYAEKKGIIVPVFSTKASVK